MVVVNGGGAGGLRSSAVTRFSSLRSVPSIDSVCFECPSICLINLRETLIVVVGLFRFNYPPHVYLFAHPLDQVYQKYGWRQQVTACSSLKKKVQISLDPYKGRLGVV
jgi:hypothetical protein